MQQLKDRDGEALFDRLRASLLMLGFGLFVLAFLIAIDRPEWFRLRPITGTAAAMSNAADRPAPKSLPGREAGTKARYDGSVS